MTPATCQCGCGAPTRMFTKNDRKSGMVKGEYARFLKGHSPPPKTFGAPRWTEDPETGCWVWGGSMRGNGYGLWQRTAAHRWVYELLVGPIPPGLDLDHLCRNRACVRPAHLEPVTRAVNLRRGAGSKLTAAIAAEIREATGTQRAIAARFGIDHTTVGSIQRGEAWA